MSRLIRASAAAVALALQEDKNMKTIYEFIVALVSHPYFQCALIAWGVILGFVIAFCLTELIQE